MPIVIILTVYIFALFCIAMCLFGFYNLFLFIKDRRAKKFPKGMQEEIERLGKRKK